MPEAHVGTSGPHQREELTACCRLLADAHGAQDVLLRLQSAVRGAAYEQPRVGPGCRP